MDTPKKLVLTMQPLDNHAEMEAEGFDVRTLRTGEPIGIYEFLPRGEEKSSLSYCDPTPAYLHWDEVVLMKVFEYLPGTNRLTLLEVLWDALKPGGVARTHVCNWTSEEAYADPLVQFPPMTRQFWNHAIKSWRDEAGLNWGPYRDMVCDFEVQSGYEMDKAVEFRADEVVAERARRDLNVIIGMPVFLRKPSA